MNLYNAQYRNQQENKQNSHREYNEQLSIAHSMSEILNKTSKTEIKEVKTKIQNFVNDLFAHNDKSYHSKNNNNQSHASSASRLNKETKEKISHFVDELAIPNQIEKEKIEHFIEDIVDTNTNHHKHNINNEDDA